MAELFTRKPLFRGEDEVAQITLIFRKCGSPTPENWPNVENLPWYKFVKPRNFYPRTIHEDLREYDLFFVLILFHFLNFHFLPNEFNSSNFLLNFHFFPKIIISFKKKII